MRQRLYDFCGVLCLAGLLATAYTLWSYRWILGYFFHGPLAACLMLVAGSLVAIIACVGAGLILNYFVLRDRINALEKRIGQRE